MLPDLRHPFPPELSSLERNLEELRFWNGLRPPTFDAKGIPADWVVKGDIDPTILARVFRLTKKIDFIPVRPSDTNQTAIDEQSRLETKFGPILYIIFHDEEYPQDLIGPVFVADLLESNPSRLISEYGQCAAEAQKQDDVDLSLAADMKFRTALLLAGERDGH